MEYSIKRVVTEKWEISNCSCGAEPEVLNRVYIHDINRHYITVKCPECQKMAEGGMASFLRISGLDAANDCMWYLDYMEKWLLSVKGKVRWQFDSQLGGGVSENATVWDRAYELGVDTMMVNDPLKLCKYIAQKHFS